VEAAADGTVISYGLPEERWRRIRTDDPLERILR
jgi:hypothetical protein